MDIKGSYPICERNSGTNQKIQKIKLKKNNKLNFLFMKALIKDKDEKKVINYTTVEGTPFTIVQHGEEFFVTIGNHKASEKIFDSLENAKKYVSVKDWDLIQSFIIRVVDYFINEQKNNKK